MVVAGTTGISAVISTRQGELIRTDFFQPRLDSQVRSRQAVTGNSMGSNPAMVLVRGSHGSRSRL